MKRLLWTLPIVLASSHLATASAEPNAQGRRAALDHTEGQAGPSGAPSCVYGAGAFASQTLPAGSPLGKAIPIDHFVVLVQENRSFDHYFQELPEHGQPGADVASPGTTNPVPGSRQPAKWRHASSYCLDDPPHDVASVERQYDHGANDGFVATGGAEALSYYGYRDLPFYYELFATFAIGDRYFSDLSGPTWPNRMMMLSGTSFGHIDNTAPPPRDVERSLFHQLEQLGLTWALYSDGKSFEEQIYPRLHRERGGNFGNVEDFLAAAEAGKLPSFAWVESKYGGADATDEHPPANVQLGQRWVWKVVEAVLNSPNWPRTALILTYDEHGGFYDHVPPPAACVPDDVRPAKAVNGQPFTFDRLGFRVPLVIVSPYSRPNYVSHQVFSHASILRLVQTRFSMPALTARDANAQPLLDLFDFKKPAFLTPPHFESPAIDPRSYRECRRTKPRPGRAAHPARPQKPRPDHQQPHGTQTKLDGHRQRRGNGGSR